MLIIEKTDSSIKEEIVIKTYTYKGYVHKKKVLIIS